MRILTIGIISILISGIILVLPAYGAPGDFSKVKLITINSTEVNSNLTDFPFLLNGTFSDVSGDIQADCDDIAFYDSTNSTQLKHEIEKCGQADDDYTFWIKIPTVNSASDTKFFMYYGNSTMTAQEDVENTWNANYELVLHLHDDFLDSTGNSYDGTNSGSTDESPAQIADGQSFDGINDNITITTANSATNLDTDTKTITGWFKTSDTSGVTALLLTAADISTGNYRESSQIDGGVGFSVNFNVGGGRWRTTTSYNDGNWHYYAITYDRSSAVNDPVIYIDGSSVSITEELTPSGSARTGTDNWRMGENVASSQDYNGEQDEARYYDGLLSADWIDFEYCNQSTLSTCPSHSVGAETDNGGGGSLTQNLSDGITAGDTLDTVGDFNRSLTDGAVFGDTIDPTTDSTNSESDGAGFGDSIEVYLECGGTGAGSCTVNLNDGIGAGDDISTNNITLVEAFNAIKLYLNSPTATRLGGVFAQSCTGSEFMTGIDTDGNIICSALPP